MSEIKFSCKEAFSHGWAMTKKYMGTIFVFSLLYLLINSAGGILDSFAGSSSISREHVDSLYDEPDQGDRFYQYLQASGYISPLGHVQEKLQNLSDPNALILPPDFEDNRQSVYHFLNQYRYRLPFPKVVYYVLSILGWIFSILTGIGFFKITLQISRDQKPTMSDFFSNWNVFIPYLLGTLCYILAMVGGFILLIVPGVIFMIMFQMYPYLIIDRGLGSMQSLNRSRAITKGCRGKLALFGLLVVLLNIGGALCLLIGVFFTIAISSIAMAYIYDRLESSYAAGEMDGQGRL